MSGAVLFGFFCTAGGLGLVLCAFRRRARRLALLRNGVRVRGQVVQLKETTTEEDVCDTYAPVVSYQAEGGQNYEIALLPRHDVKSLRVGTKVQIFYERGNPRNAVDVVRMWDVNLFCVLSFIPVLIGAGFLNTDYQEAVEQREPPTTHSP